MNISSESLLNDKVISIIHNLDLTWDYYLQAIAMYISLLLSLRTIYLNLWFMNFEIFKDKNTDRQVKVGNDYWPTLNVELKMNLNPLLACLKIYQTTVKIKTEL